MIKHPDLGKSLLIFLLMALLCTALGWWLGNLAAVKDYLYEPLVVTAFQDVEVLVPREYTEEELTTLCQNRFTVEEMIRLEALAAGLSSSEADTLVAVARCESKLNPASKNPNSSAAGVFQLLDSTQARYGVTDPYDARQNIRAGVRLYQAEGLSPWQACL